MENKEGRSESEGNGKQREPRLTGKGKPKEIKIRFVGKV